MAGNPDPGVGDDGISAQWIGLPVATPLTQGDTGGNAPAPADTVNLSLGGALDLTAMPSQIAPLDQLSSQRIADHAGLGMSNTPELAPIDGDMPDVPDTHPSQLTTDQRYEYGRQLLNGDVSGPQDFAEQLVGSAWRDAAWNDPTAKWDDHSAQATNAAKSLSTALPEHDDLHVYAAYLANQNLGPEAAQDPATVNGIKGNLLDAFGRTGTPIQQIVQTADADSDMATALVTPPAPSPVNYPSFEELAVSAPKRALDMLTLGATNSGVRKAIGDTFLQLASGLTPSAYMQQASHITGADAQQYFDAQLQPGEKLSDEQGNILAQNTQAPPTAADVAGFVAQHLTGGGQEAGAAALGSGAPSAGSMFRALFRNMSLDDARAVTAQGEEAAANIRQNTGMANHDKAMAKAALEGYYKDVNPLVPGYQKWLADFQQKNQAIAQQRDAWVKGGGDPAAFSDETVLPSTAGLTEDYHPLQTLYDHMENRPGGGRLDPSDPLYPLAEETRTLMDSRKELLQRDVSDTMGFWEDYYPHTWLDPQASVEKAFDGTYSSGRQGNGYHLQERTIPYMFDGIQRGLTPKFPNPIEGALHYIQSVDDFRAAERIRGQAIDHDGAYYARQPEPGDAPLNGRAATRLRVYNDADGNAKAYQEQLYAPQGYAQVYNNWVSRGLHQWPMVGAIYDKMLMAKNASLGLAFGLSGFHPMVMAKQGVASAFANALGEVSHGELGEALTSAGMAPLAPVRLIAKGRSFDNVYMGRAADASPLEQQLKNLYIKSGGTSPAQGRGEPYFASQARNLFTDWKRAGLGQSVDRSLANMSAAAHPGENPIRTAGLAIPRMLGAITENFGRVSDTIMSPLFDVAIPQMKRGAWADEMESYVRQHPLAEEDELLRVGRQTMDSMDDRFGEMNMDNVFWNKAIKQIANLVTVSQGWEYGSWRAAGRGLEDLTLAPTGQRFTTRARVLLGYTAAMALASTAYQAFKTGTTPFSTGVSNFVTPLSRSNDPTSAVQIPGEEKEAVRIYSLMKQAGNDPAKWPGVVGAYLGGKAQPIVRDVEALMNNKGTQDFLKKLYGNHQPAVMWPNTGSANLSPVERFLGIHSAPAAITGASSPRQPRSERTEEHRGAGTRLREMGVQVPHKEAPRENTGRRRRREDE